MNNIKIIIKNLKNSYLKYLKRSYYGISIIIFLWLSWFMYQSVYMATEDIKVLFVLKNQVAQKTVDMQTWNKVNKNIEWKKQILIDTALLNNPFK